MNTGTHSHSPPVQTPLCVLCGVDFHGVFLVVLRHVRPVFQRIAHIVPVPRTLQGGDTSEGVIAGCPGALNIHKVLPAREAEDVHPSLGLFSFFARGIPELWSARLFRQRRNKDRMKRAVLQATMAAVLVTALALSGAACTFPSDSFLFLLFVLFFSSPFLSFLLSSRSFLFLLFSSFFPFFPSSETPFSRFAAQEPQSEIPIPLHPLPLGKLGVLLAGKGGNEKIGSFRLLSKSSFFLCSLPHFCAPSHISVRRGVRKKPEHHQSPVWRE